MATNVQFHGLPCRAVTSGVRRVAGCGRWPVEMTPDVNHLRIDAS